ncbi:MAG TPA: DUF488 domain-containing protein [Thermodesulfobacteriota bacterium]|nr:DUF488 domain-containing protein [Thermodesulfobacteriota bacterium]
MIKIKRIYDPPSPGDGQRILVDRLWPRGMKKEEAHIDEWLKEISPSNELRKWYSHDPAKWPEFKRRYRAEISRETDLLKRIKNEGKKGTVTLLFSSKELELNNATALKEIVEGLR